jgi:hypothetical protein
MAESVYLVVWNGVVGPADLHSAEVFKSQALAEARARALWAPEGDQAAPQAVSQPAPANPRGTGSGGIQIVEEEVWVAGGEDSEVTDFPARRERRGQAPGSPVLTISDPESEDEGAQLEVWELPLQG